MYYFRCQFYRFDSVNTKGFLSSPENIHWEQVGSDPDRELICEAGGCAVWRAVGEEAFPQKDVVSDEPPELQLEGSLYHPVWRTQQEEFKES